MSVSKKRVILVDHNEKSQAVDGIEEAEIMEIMERNSSVEAAAGALLERVLEKGARDNATIILCEIEQDTHPLRSWFLQNKKENEGDRL